MNDSPIQIGDMVWIEEFLPDPVKIVDGIVYKSHPGELRFYGVVELQNQRKVKIKRGQARHLIKADIFSIAYWRKYGNAPESLRLKFIPF